MHYAFGLAAHICSQPISIDVAIFKVIQCVKEFTNGALYLWWLFLAQDAVHEVRSAARKYLKWGGQQ